MSFGFNRELNEEEKIAVDAMTFDELNLLKSTDEKGVWSKYHAEKWKELKPADEGKISGDWENSRRLGLNPFAGEGRR